VFVTSVDYLGAGVIQTITFDAIGVWNGTLYSSFENSPTSLNIVVSILEPNSKVLHISASQLVTGLPNCD